MQGGREREREPKLLGSCHSLTVKDILFLLLLCNVIVPTYITNDGLVESSFVFIVFFFLFKKVLVIYFRLTPNSVFCFAIGNS